MKKIRESLTNQQFGNWIVIEEDQQRNGYWVCQCQCEEHRIKSVYYWSLVKGLSKSCGCLQKQAVSKANKKYNKYDLSGDYGVGWTNNGDKFYFDLEDYDLIKDCCWNVDTTGYLRGKDVDDWRKTHAIHRIIMGCSDPSIFVDHINHNKLDNRKCNLRLVTPAQNTYNKGIQPYNTSKEIGVYYHQQRKKWVAQITHNDNHYCTYCLTKEEAVKARKEYEDIFFGEYGYHNSLKLEEGVEVNGDN